MSTNIYRIGLICIIILATACDSSLEEENIKSEMEQLIIKNWQFVSIEANEHQIIKLLQGFEPSHSFGRSIPWYWFSYNSDLSYEFRTDVGKISYGYENNYQPQYGFWQLIEEQDLLIHNNGMPNEKTYKIIALTDTLFIREYERVIYQSTDTIKWPIGETVIYREVLEKRNGPCCGDN